MHKKEQWKQQETPNCIGVIIDGNRRWAKGRGIATLKGHRAGYEKLKEFISWAREAGVKRLIFYGFSTENWKRDKKEKSYLFELIKEAFINDLEEMKDNNVRIKFAGQIDRFDLDIQAILRDAEDQTRKNTETTVIFALSYGGRAEILHAVNMLISDGEKKSISEEKFAKHLWISDIPDLIIRTGGEIRLSGFLPWQSVYSELFFTKTHWPAFSQEEFKTILEQFNARVRNYGK